MSELNTEILNQLEKTLGENRVKTEFNLAPYLTLRTNPVAEFYFEAASRAELIASKRITLKLRLPFFIIGGGSNLAIVQKKLPGLTVRNRYIFKKVADQKDYAILTVSSGYPVTRLAKELADQGLSGLEYHFGLPGTVGGAIFMNSKWTKPVSYFGDSLISADILDDQGKVKKVHRDYFAFAYDQSILQKKPEILLEATFKLKKIPSEKTQENARSAADYRRLTQPSGVFTSGCFFRNVDGRSAGKMIDLAGLKGNRVGKFHVSEKHANFIINDGDGDPEDLKTLLDRIKQTVNNKFGVRLKEEVIIV